VKKQGDLKKRQLDKKEGKGGFFRGLCAHITILFSRNERACPLRFFRDFLRSIFLLSPRSLSRRYTRRPSGNNEIAKASQLKRSGSSVSL